MCLMSANVSLESDPALQAFVFEGDANSVCSSAPSEVEAMGLLAATQDACSVGSGTESADSDSDSESSHGDLNTLSSDSGDDDSIVYELFPSVSFSSLTGIQCRDGCTKVTIRDFDSESDLRVSEALIRGRSRVRSRGRRGQGRAGAGAMRTRGVSSRSSNFGFNSDKGVQDVGEEDSIISCKAEEPVSVSNSKVMPRLWASTNSQHVSLGSNRKESCRAKFVRLCSSENTTFKRYCVLRVFLKTLSVWNQA